MAIIVLGPMEQGRVRTLRTLPHIDDVVDILCNVFAAHPDTDLELKGALAFLAIAIIASTHLVFQPDAAAVTAGHADTRGRAGVYAALRIAQAAQVFDVVGAVVPGINGRAPAAVVLGLVLVMTDLRA